MCLLDDPTLHYSPQPAVYSDEKNTAYWSMEGLHQKAQWGAAM